MKRFTGRSDTDSDEGGGPEAGFPTVSILVAARDEEEHIADCLESLVRQRYPSDRYEIVLVNDRSTDRTLTIINEYQEKHGMVRCINVDSCPPGLTGKQNALKQGLRFCTGEIILNTDADCVVGPLWVRRTVSYFVDQEGSGWGRKSWAGKSGFVADEGRHRGLAKPKGDIGLTIGFSTVHNPDPSRQTFSQSLYSDLQSLDMLFLMDAAAGAIGVGVPVSCLGRNLAYRSAIVDSIDYVKMGYTITEDAALIRMVAKRKDCEITVVYDKDAVVSTVAEETIKGFLSQRIRWVMGGQATRLWVQVPLHAIFLFHLSLVVSLPLVFLIRAFAIVALSSFSAKVILDFIRCWRVCEEFGRADLLKLFVPYEVFMVFYIVLIGLGSLFIRRVKWKGEIYARKRKPHS